MDTCTLQPAIHNVYEAFSEVPKPDDIEAHDQLISREEVDVLLETPLRALTEQQLVSFATNVLVMYGGVEHFLYFLPRILELTVADDLAEVEVTLSRLKKANWATWPASLREPVKALIDQTFGLVTNEGLVHEIDEWLCAVGQCVDDLQPYLKILEKNASEERLGELFCINTRVYEGGMPENPFWGNNPQTASQVAAWMRTDPMRRVYQLSSVGLSRGPFNNSDY